MSTLIVAQSTILVDRLTMRLIDYLGRSIEIVLDPLCAFQVLDSKDAATSALTPVLWMALTTSSPVSLQVPQKYCILSQSPAKH
jgi:hypothetical protein